MLLFVYIGSTSNIYWFIGIQINCQQIQTKSYSVTFGYTQYLVQHSMNDPEGKKTTICRYLVTGHTLLLSDMLLIPANLKLCSKQYNRIFVLHLIVVPQTSSGWQHNYSTKKGRQAMPISSLCIFLCLCIFRIDIKRKKMLQVFYVPATSTTFSLFSFFLAVAINSTNETNKAGSMCYSSVYLSWVSMVFCCRIER
jgi:hypothetical protein